MSDQTPVVRASDAEREQTADLLRQSMIAGRLTLEEFAQRVEAVYAARTRAELDAVMRDLPSESHLPEQRRRLRPKRLTGVVFGSVERKGRWRVPRFTALVAVFGDADIDLRTAEIDGRSVTITAVLLFGNADFYVPTGVDVDLGGFTMFGHRREHGEELEPAPGTPLIRIRVYSFFGTSDVWRIAPGVSGSFRELIEWVRARGKLDPG